MDDFLKFIPYCLLLGAMPRQIERRIATEAQLLVKVLSNGQ
jgi:hypothetical protein